MKIKLLKQFGVNGPGTVLDLPFSSAELVVARGAAEWVDEDPKAFADETPKNKSMQKAQVKRK